MNYTACVGQFCRKGVQLASLPKHVKSPLMFLPAGRRTFSLLQSNKVFLVDVLRDKVQRGELIHDVAQEKAAKRLTRLQEALDGYCNKSIISQIETEQENQPKNQQQIIQQQQNHTDTKNTEGSKVRTHHTNESKNNIESSSSSSSSSSSPPTPPVTNLTQIPRGLFIHGNVGIGKSFLMDLFYENTLIHKKRRVHFHSFMQDIHQRIYKLKQKDLQTIGRNFAVDTSTENNPIHRVGIQLANEVALLCFDEFQVTDVADALILSQLFSVLFQRGTVIVATSNRHPSTLYEGGLNRGYFLPFIDLLCHHCIIHDIDASIDYRSLGAEGIETFFFSLNSDNDDLGSQYNDVLRGHWNEEKSVEKTLDTAFGRKLNVATSADGSIAKFTFDQLCNVELGSSDYRAIAQYFNLIIIEGIPQLSLKEHDQARRFITLVDELYEANCSLLCNAAADPNNLFIGRNTVDRVALSTSCVDTPSIVLQNNESAEDVDISETLGIDVAQSNGVAMGELASVRELSFAFRRAASRLKEMSSRRHWENNGII